MSLWQTEGPRNEIVQLVQRIGLEKAAEVLNRGLDEISLSITNMRYLSDFQSFAEDRLSIKDKFGKIIKFRLNTPQRKLNEAIEKQKKLGKPVRIRMLKARQFGGSTEIEGYIFRDSMLRTNRESMIVTHSIESSNHLREMSGRYYDYYPLEKPLLKKPTDKLWKFKHEVGGRSVESKIRIETAENLGAGHSFTLHNLHLSEIQKWPHAAELVRGLYPTVPNSPDTMIFEEGTGSGVGDYWYDSCQAAMGGSDWEFVFVPWFELDDTIMEFKDGARTRFEQSLTAEEKTLIDLHHISLERVQWRRYKLENEFKTDPDGFCQQYPATPDEAFLTSGRPVFSPTKVKQNLAQAKPPTKRGNLRWKIEADKKTPAAVVFDEDEAGFWEFWEEPKKNVQNLYVLGIDISEGIAVIPELGNRGGDFSAIKGLKRDERRVTIKLHARLDNDVLADEIHKCSVYLGGAQCVGVFPEQNAGGGGNVVINHLKRLDIYLIKTPTFGKRHDEGKDEYGWETMSNTKRMAIDQLTEEIREGTFKDPDKDFWYECSTYVRDEKGKTNAQRGKYDDLVMAGAIMLQGDLLMSAPWKSVKDEKQNRPRDLDVPYERERTVTQESVMESNYV